MKRIVFGLTLAFLAAGEGAAAEAEGLIKLRDPLDEPEFYCLDVPGFRDRVQLKAPLMAHTCKPGAADELFTVGRPATGQLYMQAYKLCVEAGLAAADAELFLRPCSEARLQRFDLESDGKFRLAGSELCVAVAGGDGAPTGGPSHLRRDLMLQPCESAAPRLSRWVYPARE